MARVGIVTATCDHGESMTKRRKRWSVGLVALLFVQPAGCEDEECEEVDETYQPVIDPASFVAVVDNSHFPLTPGTKWVYQNGDERIEVTVTSDSKSVLGVPCVVVHDTVAIGGNVLEDTYDWYAQDVDGTVWYFGEDSTEYEDGEASTEGSWEAGVDGAQPGIIMHAAPQVGSVYRQEYFACEAEDMGEVLSLNEAVTVPYGSFTDCVKTRDYTPLEPDVNEEKYYCPGVGLTLEVDLTTGERTELIELVQP